MPNYYGMGSDLRPLTEACHKRDIPLLVDEAHGAHYGQHPSADERFVMRSGWCGSIHTQDVSRHDDGSHRMYRAGAGPKGAPAAGHGAELQPLVPAHGFAGSGAAPATRRAQAPSRLALPPWRPSGEASRSAALRRRRAGARRGHGRGGTRQDPFKAVIYDRTGSLSGYAPSAH